MSALGPQFLYHGNFAGLAKGDRVSSSATRGTKANFPIQSGDSPEVAYASEREGVAWDFAHMASERNSQRLRVQGIQPRSSVAKVTAHPDQQMGRYHENHPSNPSSEKLGEWTAPHFDVHERIDIKPGHQGTFPEINWNAHKEDRLRLEPTHNDAINHPTDDHIEYGHPGGQMNQEHLKNLGKQWDTTKPEVDIHQPSIPGLEIWQVTGNVR